VAHSRDDGLIPFWMAEKLRDAVDGKADWVELDGGHNDHPFDATPGYAQKFKHFVRNSGLNR